MSCIWQVIPKRRHQYYVRSHDLEHFTRLRLVFFDGCLVFHFKDELTAGTFDLKT